ncbi:hypothetical protein [Jeotgalibacillus salarius]|uniref:DUF3953 domain-containing protein n=1 Tax=Jeotgalibacillus salarius TaxID=546023 RepID=A0A4Y8LE39_9BACL|nr:hypothetical protein [Jeotgalibacillus salarius]TFE00586.1 hypothetical protein E2626_11460 [Jeotgalibacillus salarius]
MISKLQENMQNRNKYLLVLKILFNAIALFYSVQIIYLAFSALFSQDASNGVTDTMLSGMIFFLALSNAVTLAEMAATGKKEYFKLLLITTLFMFLVAFLIV